MLLEEKKLCDLVSFRSFGITLSVVPHQSEDFCIPSSILDIAAMLNYMDSVEMLPFPKKESLGTLESYWRHWGLLLTGIPDVTVKYWCSSDSDCDPELVRPEVTNQLIGQTIGRGMKISYHGEDHLVTGLAMWNHGDDDGTVVTEELVADLYIFSATPSHFIDLEE